jgi:Cys-tRNA(Pro)/Cys-tRNA(Cys) deacylase
VATATRATALLVRNRVTHTIHAYPHDPRAEAFGEEAARALGVSEERLFKTLVAVVDGKLVCAVVPVSGRLSLKALAAALGGNWPPPSAESGRIWPIRRQLRERPAT